MPVISLSSMGNLSWVVFTRSLQFLAIIPISFLLTALLNEKALRLSPRFCTLTYLLRLIVAWKFYLTNMS